MTIEVFKISVEYIQLDPLNFYQEHLCLPWEGMTTNHCWRDIVVHMRYWHSFPIAL